MGKESQEHLLEAVDQTDVQAVVSTYEYEAFAKDTTIPDFKIKTSKLDDWQEGLSNNTDPYGRACFVFANELAKNLENTIVDTGRPFSELSSAEIKEAEHKADEVVGGITGFMYGVAISCLADVWEYGEELRKHHNTQMGNPQAKGTINPAIINIG